MFLFPLTWRSVSSLSCLLFGFEATTVPMSTVLSKKKKNDVKISEYKKETALFFFPARKKEVGLSERTAVNIGERIRWSSLSK